jgi:hypothetical protein
MLSSSRQPWQKVSAELFLEELSDFEHSFDVYLLIVVNIDPS